MKSSLLIGVLTGCLTLASTGFAGAAGVGETRIAKWKDDRQAAFLLMFDDGWPSHWQVAVPELAKRGLIATFYINPGKGEYQKFAEKWENEVPASGMVLANHTMTHKGVKDLEDARRELGECNQIVRNIQPGKERRLVSYGQPGVPPGSWNITSEELETLLKEYNMISRPPFQGHGAVYHQKTLEEMTALVDKALAEGGMEYLVVHGVERIGWSYQDMWALKQEIFFPLLDGLKEKSDRGELWVTDHISQHQYETERDQAKVTVDKVEEKRISLTLKADLDQDQYDFPLTLITKVPSSWSHAAVSQDGKTQDVGVRDGQVRFDAVPNGGPIHLTPSTGQVQAAAPN